MNVVLITKEEALKLGSRQYGLTSGKRDAITGIRPLLHFCEIGVFVKNFNREKTFITI